MVKCWWVQQGQDKCPLSHIAGDTLQLGSLVSFVTNTYCSDNPSDRTKPNKNPFRSAAFLVLELGRSLSLSHVSFTPSYKNKLFATQPERKLYCQKISACVFQTLIKWLLRCGVPRKCTLFYFFLSNLSSGCTTPQHKIGIISVNSKKKAHFVL